MSKDSGVVRKKATPTRFWLLLSLGMSEIIGTGMLIFMGCLGGVPGLLSSSPSHLEKSLVFGVTVSIIVQVFGHVSGAHLNPAVTAAAWVWGGMTLSTAAVYIVSQFVGGVLGYATILMMTPTEAFFPDGIESNVTHAFCTTVPNPKVTTLQALLGEYFATAFLILLCCGVWDSRNATKQDSVPLKFGLTISALALAVGPYSGASLNPARSFAPALFTGVWDRHWIYWVGPLAAGVLITYFYKFLFDRDQSQGESDQSDIPLNQTNSKIQNAEKSSTEALASV